MLKKIAYFSLILLISCGENETNHRSNEEPEAFQEKSIDIGRFRKGNDLVEDLYQELVEKSPELKSLEDELSQLNTRDTANIFYNYNQKSNDYYRDAENHTNSITDSVMKQKIVNLITKSSDKYVSKKADLKNLMNTINEKRNEINNYHSALKIILTIPLIEEYQKQHLPNKSPYEKVIKKEDLLLEKIKNITPKY
jgi:DNA anti-recombination protein RmuC